MLRASIGIALAALGGFLLVTALGIGGAARPARRTPEVLTPLATYSARVPHVRSALVIDSVQGAVQGASATPGAELPPLPASAFAKPVAEYRRYALDQLDVMDGQVARLQRALAAGDRASAQEAWRAAYARYLRLGAVYLTGEVATLNRSIDGDAGGLPGGARSSGFTGLHRIEAGLWTATPPQALLGWAQRLDVDVRRLHSTIAHVSIAPLEYATRAHEILEDAARDLLSGADVPWSGEGVLATDAGLAATEEVMATLRPLLVGRENVTANVATELALLRASMVSLAAAHGGRLPSNWQLTQPQSELLDGTLGGALEALAQVPGALETEAALQVPQIPLRDLRVDP